MTRTLEKHLAGLQKLAGVETELKTALGGQTKYPVLRQHLQELQTLGPVRADLAKLITDSRIDSSPALVRHLIDLSELAEVEAELSALLAELEG